MVQGLNRTDTESKMIIFILPFFVFITIFILLFSLERSQPLVHDEAVYLTKARSWQEGTPADEFRIYRPIGMALFGRAFLLFGDSEQVVRLFGVFSGALTATFIYLLFKRVFNWIIAITVTIVMVSSTLFLQNAPQFLNDIPSAGFLLGCLWVIWDWYATKGRSKLIYLFAPFSALAFYLRYGSASALVIITGCSLFVLGLRIVKKEGVSYGKIFNTFILSIILFALHFIESIEATKSFLGILSRSGSAAGREYLGEGLFNYIKWLPNELGGWVLGVGLIIGMITGVIIISIKKFRKKYTSLAWLSLVGLLSFILTGILVHAEPRYVFFPAVIFVGLGLGGVSLVCYRVKLLKFIYFGLFLAVAIFFGRKNYFESVDFFNDKIAGSRRSYIEASLAIRRDTSGGKECSIWSSSFRPELSWYAECHTFNISNKDTFKKDFLINFRSSQYSIVYSKQNSKQLDENVAKEFGVFLSEIFRTRVSQSIGDLIVYKINDQNKIRFESSIEKE